MKKPIFAVIISIIFLFSFYFQLAVAGVNRNSIFYKARHPASELDVQLYEIENSWRIRFPKNPDEEIKKRFPLISRTRVLIELDYDRADDRISATGWIMNLDEFLKLSKNERKKLVLSLLENIKWSLARTIKVVDKQTGAREKQFNNQYIILSIIINDIRVDDKGRNINWFLPFDIGMGVAGYKDRQFVFSEDYFLNLKINNGMALSGDPKKFIIQKE